MAERMNELVVGELVAHQEQCNDTDSALPSPPHIPSHLRTRIPNVLMTLPPKLRIIIYEYALAWPPRTYIIWRTGDLEIQKPPLLKVATPEMRKEVAPIFYHANNISLDLRVDRDDIAWIVTALRGVADLCGSDPFSTFSFWFTRTRNETGKESLLEVLPLLELIRDTGLRFGTANKIIAGLKYQSTRIEELEEALATGLQAHEAGWSEKELAVAFMGWCDNLEKRIWERRERYFR